MFAPPPTPLCELTHNNDSCCVGRDGLKPWSQPRTSLARVFPEGSPQARGIATFLGNYSGAYVH